MILLEMPESHPHRLSNKTNSNTRDKTQPDLLKEKKKIP